MFSQAAYLKLHGFIVSKKYRFNILKFIYKILPVFVFIAYPILLVYVLFNRIDCLLRCITVPLGVFITVTLIRKFLNFSRPYEQLEITPLFPKETKGKSFPSRHTACASVIAMTFLYVNIPIGIIFLSVAVLIAASRVAAGVHYPRDVIAGFLYSVIMSVIFFYFL